MEFSPDSKYLMTGPVNNTPEEQALIESDTGNIIWTFNTGAYMREARFSEDGKTVYLASGNGTLYAIDVTTGNKKWLGSGDYYIPFVLGLSESAGTIIASGKGRAFTALDLDNGKQKWQSTVDQTTTAGEVAEDGSVVGGTVGGMGYGIDKDGDIIWARKYGGVGHNAVYYTRNGNYSIFGGPNPTLFDSEGNVLWQREPDKEIQMSGPNDINTGAAYDTWMSGDGKLLIIGGDDGNIEFYKGEVKEGSNSYSQLTGTNVRISNDIDDVILEELEPRKNSEKIIDFLKNPLVIGGIILVIVIISGIGVIVITRVVKGRKKEKSETQELQSQE
jgi:outer membrane protein assembly factor BamB